MVTEYIKKCAEEGTLKVAFPDPQSERKDWLCLNGEWDFSFDAPDFDRKINVPYPWGSPLSGIDESKDGTGYYRKNVAWDTPAKRIFLCFGAVDYSCEVFVNGKKVGSHRGGYSKFAFEVSDLWRRDSENEIKVVATDIGDKNVQPYGKQGYGNARGIWQSVWLEGRGAAYIDNFAFTTPLDGSITCRVSTVGAEDGSEITAAFGGQVASSYVYDNAAEVMFFIDDPRLWTPETPCLYEGTLTLTDKGSVDTVYTYFGIRDIGSGVFGEHGRRYITLNGKPYFINGVLDQSFNPDGYFTLPSDTDCRDEILRLKRIGINTARIHIKAEEPLKLYYADKLGLLVMEDFPCFWGEPEGEAKVTFEREMEAQVLRDRNHPCVFCWVVFNETWGLFHYEDDSESGAKKRIYKEETARWVISCCEKVHRLDRTRLIEDNSPCNGDHTVTDVNTWHFYSNGYERVKKVVDDFCRLAYVGSKNNYKEGYYMEDVPCMNSECGNVWGITGNAGDSDISWQYKYMINEFRRHDKLCGFVFTEFHDVVNEFNGYYKIDGTDKETGYGDAFGMTINDLHSADYLGFDYPPMKTVKPGERVEIDMFGSSFTEENHGKELTVSCVLMLCDPATGENIPAFAGEYPVLWRGYGTFGAGKVAFTVPEFDGTAVLRFTLCAPDGGVIMRNAVAFDIDGERAGGVYAEPSEFRAEGFKKVITAQSGNKVSGLGCGSFSVDIDISSIPGFDPLGGLEVIFEASTRAPMTHDFPDGEKKSEADNSYMLGYRCDPAANPNSFAQTDEYLYPGSVEVLIDGMLCGSAYLPDSPADSRGMLSHHYQSSDYLLDEAGSYGYLCRVKIPSKVMLGLIGKEKFTLTLRVPGGADHGLSLFGRRSGRYGTALCIL